MYLKITSLTYYHKKAIFALVDEYLQYPQNFTLHPQERWWCTSLYEMVRAMQLCQQEKKNPFSTLNLSQLEKKSLLPVLIQV